MIANKFWVRGGVGLFLLALGGAALAVQNLDAHGQAKVDNAMAKKWSQSSGKTGGYQSQQDKSVVNVGSKRGGDCVVNVGTVQKGQKAPKDIVVTTKEVINVCK
ncbi:MAG: hypothetical protein AUK53_07450 [Betaproteobacteria bacterium CG2_30_59_46]|nr:MAG: hypothetical protein AUK53_07450 [Betaproteobacteria bacterium CG2_30_59_46]